MPRIVLPSRSGDGDEKTSVISSPASSLDKACSIIHPLLVMQLGPGY